MALSAGSAGAPDLEFGRRLGAGEAHLAEDTARDAAHRRVGGVLRHQPLGQLLGRGLRDRGRMRLLQVEAAARDDVQARTPRKARESGQVAAAVRQGLVHDRGCTGVAERDELAHREVLVVQKHVLAVSVRLRPDRRQVGRRERLVEEPRFASLRGSSRCTVSVLRMCS